MVRQAPVICVMAPPIRLGVWSMIIIIATEFETNFESTRPLSLREVRYEEACNRIAVEAVRRGCTDNVTVMIIDIQEPLS